MKALLIVYRLITFIVLPAAVLLGFVDLSLLVAAIANPAALLPVFAIACMVIYVFTSLSFLNKGITGGRKCRPSLRDWIRVNAFVSIPFCIMFIVEAITVLPDKALFQQIISQSQTMSLPAGFSNAELTPALLEQTLRTTFYFILIFSFLLLIHIFTSFFLLKKYRFLFSENQNAE